MMVPRLSKDATQQGRGVRAVLMGALSLVLLSADTTALATAPSPPQTSQTAQTSQTSQLSQAAQASVEANEELKTVVILLKHMTATRAIAIYERVLGNSAGTTIAPGKDNRSIAVKDTRTRIARFRVLVRALDLPGARLRVYVRPVIHRGPAELAALLNEVLTARDSHHNVAIVPDIASRQLVISATKRMYMHVIDPLARRLDQRAAPKR